MSAVDIGAPGRDATYGAGRLNVPGAFAILNARYPSTAAISINGLARVGTTLTALSASSPSTVQWYRCQQIGTDSTAVPADCTPISGATTAAYKVTSTDMRKTLRVGATINGQARFSATLGKVIAIWSRDAKLTVGAPAKLSTLLGSPSTGARSIRLLSGNCSIRNLTVVAFTPGTCRIKVSIAAKSPFPALAMTFDVSTN
ncbi:MAG: hypothetical protein EB132_04285 [Actinobacteria bacterium]|nr:hypothetical protein [Actinomycetota bacterium]